MELNMHEPHQNSDGVGRDQIRFENAPILDLSIIIVSWNAKDYLVKCLKSLAHAPAIGTMEIIVVDNDSSDGSPEAVERDFPSVRLVRSGGNLGFARANNIGMRMSKGRYLALINSDVEVLGDCLGRLVDYCEKNPKVGMVGPHIIGRDRKLQRGDLPNARRALEASLAAARARKNVFETTLSLLSLIELHRLEGVEAPPQMVNESNSLLDRLKIRVVPAVPLAVR
jgi:glycosyltransferase involved in cell wall biosynthesis